jgi:dUTPase
MTDTIKFLKIRDVKSPSRAYDYDAGIDFFVPTFDASFVKDLKEKNPIIWPIKPKYEGDSYCYTTPTLTMQGQPTSGVKIQYELTDDNDTQIKFDDEEGKNYFLLAPGSRVNIPSGIKSRMANPGRALIAFNKSGIATIYGLVAGACVVDYLYQGEIHLSLINTSTKVVKIYEGMKILQFVETPVFNSEIEIKEIDFKANSKGPKFFQTIIEDESFEFYKGMQTDRGQSGFDSTQNK